MKNSLKHIPSLTQAAVFSASILLWTVSGKAADILYPQESALHFWWEQYKRCIENRREDQIRKNISTTIREQEITPKVFDEEALEKITSLILESEEKLTQIQLENIDTLDVSTILEIFDIIEKLTTNLYFNLRDYISSNNSPQYQDPWAHAPWKAIYIKTMDLHELKERIEDSENIQLQETFSTLFLISEKLLDSRFLSTYEGGKELFTETRKLFESEYQYWEYENYLKDNKISTILSKLQRKDLWFIQEGVGEFQDMKKIIDQVWFFVRDIFVELKMDSSMSLQEVLTSPKVCTPKYIQEYLQETFLDEVHEHVGNDPMKQQKYKAYNMKHLFHIQGFLGNYAEDKMIRNMRTLVGWMPEDMRKDIENLHTQKEIFDYIRDDPFALSEIKYFLKELFGEVYIRGDTNVDNKSGIFDQIEDLLQWQEKLILEQNDYIYNPEKKKI